jgi:cyclopropane fatty-acyl-phospholipid synthase-like methyltransferase
MNLSKDFSKQDYWNNYYSKISKSSKKTIPSQFATFCLSEMQDQGIEEVIEFGSGNGRDAIFFAEYGINVVATDSSKASVHTLKKKTNLIKNIEVFQYDVSTDFNNILKLNNKSVSVYARFLIHALDVEKVKNFFENCSNILCDKGLIFIEYRNQQDRELQKVTEPHFREFYDPNFINEIAKSFDFKLFYEVSGKGYAKWKHDDANVTRQIFKKIF